MADIDTVATEDDIAQLGGGEETTTEAPAEELSTGGEVDGDRRATEEHDDDEDPGERSGLSEDEKRERNRKWREEKKRRQQEREESHRREIASLQSVIEQQNERLSVIERKASGMELGTLDVHIKQSADAYMYFKDQIRVGSETQNHALVADAVEKMTLAKQRYDELTNVKKAYQQRQQAPAPLDPRVTNYATSWHDKNKWYDPDGRDEDSSVAITIDRRLAAEGYHPGTKEYWDELDARLKKYLPHRYKQGYNPDQGSRSGRGTRGSPVAGSGGNNGTGSRGSSFTLSEERVKALKEAGLWDDPKKRTEAIKRFQSYDKENA